MKYVFHNYPRQLILVCFLLNPKISIFLHYKDFPSLLINLSYVNEARMVAQFWEGGVIKGSVFRETAEKGSHSKGSFCLLERVKQT